MVIGSSGLPVGFISCISAFPIEVTRSEISMGFPPKVLSQEPARLFSLSKDFCASDCAKAKVESDIRATDSAKRRDLMVLAPCEVHLCSRGELFAGVLRISLRRASY